MAEYHCRVYGKDGVEAQSTHLRIESDHLRLTDSAYAESPFAFDAVRLELVGAGPYCVQLRVPDLTGDLTIVISDIDILNKFAALPANNKLGLQARQLKEALVKKHRSHRKTWTIVAAVLIGVPLLCFLFLNAAINQFIAGLDPSYESRLGGWIAEAQAKQIAPKLQAEEKRVREIGTRMLAQMSGAPYKFHFFVADDKEVNACAYPGGVVVVNSGLVQSANDDELAGVIGHEIGHVLHRDTLRATLHDLSLGLSFSAFTHLIGLGGEVGDLQGKHMADLMEKMESLNFSRGQESAADREGVRLAMKAGYSGDGSVSFFEKELKKKGTVGGVVERLGGLFSTHPLDAERIAAIKAEIAKYKADGKAGK